MKTTIQTQDHKSIIPVIATGAAFEQGDVADEEIVEYERAAIKSSANYALAATVITTFVDFFCIGAILAIAWSTRIIRAHFSPVIEKKTAATQEPWQTALAAICLLVCTARVILYAAFWYKVLMQ